MLTKKNAVLAVGTLLGFCSFGVTTFESEPAADAGSPEVLTDRCSGEVAFTPSYGVPPLSHGSVVMKRQHDGYSPATTLTVKPSDDGHVRWWCHSTTGNFFDPGTWRISSNTNAFSGCLLSLVQPIESDKVNIGQCAKSITVTTSAFDGWTPEQSRCTNHTGKLRVRLGPDRLLTTECL